MIIGSGIDVIETSRLERELTRASWQARHGIFTNDELRYLNSSRNPALSFAGCFAAKEAALKALGIELSSLAHFCEVEILPDPDRTWKLNLRGQSLSTCQKLGVQRSRVAIATSRKLSGAIVVFET